MSFLRQHLSLQNFLHYLMTLQRFMWKIIVALTLNLAYSFSLSECNSGSVEKREMAYFIIGADVSNYIRQCTRVKLHNRACVQVYTHSSPSSLSPALYLINHTLRAAQFEFTRRSRQINQSRPLFVRST